VAVSGSVPWSASVLVAGATAMLESVAAVTVTVVWPTMLPIVAVTMLVPGASVVATPPEVSETAAGALESHVDEEVTSATDPSEYVPVAVKGKVTLAPNTGLVGVSAIDVSDAPLTCSAAVPEIVPTVAVIVTDPAAMPCAVPPDTEAMPGVDELQAAAAVTSWVV
jgi:hypothetical protein